MTLKVTVILTVVFTVAYAVIGEFQPWVYVPLALLLVSKAVKAAINRSYGPAEPDRNHQAKADAKSDAALRSLDRLRY